MMPVDERLPFAVTRSGRIYEQIQRLPVTVVLEDLRSLFNVGSFFRTCDSAGVDRLVLAGITGTPPQRGILKTALGAEDSVPWEYQIDAKSAALRCREQGFEVAAVETSLHSVDLFDWSPRFPVCLIFGNEVEGITPETAALADTHVRIPMLGRKHSLNVATAGGVVLYELLRKYKELFTA